MNISVNFTNPFVLVFLCGTLATLLINHFLEFIDYRARAKNGGHIPEVLQNIPLAAQTFDTEKLKNISAYEDAKYFKWCFSSVLTVALDLALVLFALLIVIDANKKDISCVFEHLAGVTFFVNLTDGRIGVLVEFQFQNYRRTVDISARNQNKVGKTFARSKFAVNDIIVFGGNESDKKHTRQ